MRIAFHKGDENTRVLQVFDNGAEYRKITSSGSTLGFQYFSLYTDETAEIKLCLADPISNTDVWLSITEVRPGELTSVKYYCLRYFNRRHESYLTLDLH